MKVIQQCLICWAICLSNGYANINSADEIKSEITKLTKEELEYIKKIEAFSYKIIERTNNVMALLQKTYPNMNNLLSVKNLGNQDHIVRSKKQLNIFYGNIDTVEGKLVEEMMIIKNQIQEIPFDNKKFKNELLQGFELGLKDGLKVFREYFSLQKESVLKIIELLDFLSAKQGNYKEQNGQLVFQTKEDSYKYLCFMQSLVNLSSKQQIIFNEITKSRNNFSTNVQCW